jgi:Ca2+-transporting ATPase
MLIALLELIIDPACSVVLEAEQEEAGLMRRPPRPRESPLLSRALLGWCLLQGVAALAAVMVVFVVATRGTPAPDAVRARVFLALLVANFALILVNRTYASSLRAALGRPNKMLGWGVGITLVVVVSLFALPGARRFFGLAQLHAGEIAQSAMAGVVLLLLLELLKPAWRGRLHA